MLCQILNPIVVKRYARLVLALFVVSVLNISMQIPAHAAMKMQMQQSDMSTMSDCHCPPAICDSVLALDNQSFNEMPPIPALKEQVGIVIAVIDPDQGQLNLDQHVDVLFLEAAQSAPPALLIKTLLLI